VKHLKTALIIAALSTLGPFSTDTYFPSFPALAAHFHVSEIQVQATLSFYLVALAGMNLFHGALSDSFGRRSVMGVMLAVFSLSALACVVAPSFGWLLALRVIQGLAAGVGMIVSRAMIRDLFQGVEAEQLMAQVAMLGGAGPIIAPIFGGWLHVWFGWRGPFVVLGLLGVALLLACRYGLSESLPVPLRHSFHPGKLSRAYLASFKTPAFLLSCFALAFGGGGFLLYVATAPDVVLNIFHLSETQFGWLFVPLISGLILGSAVGSKLMGRLPPARLVRLGFGLMAAGAAVNIAASLWLAPRVPWAVLPLTLYTFGFSFVAPVVTIEGLDMIPQRKGLAASLQGFTQVLVFALIASLAARLVYHSGIKHAVGLAILMGLSWLAYQGSQRFSVRPAECDRPTRLSPDDVVFHAVGNLRKPSAG
jgi:DHA1 family bicyclomycin/chloramphenicol resistance-like MFS transporter